MTHSYGERLYRKLSDSEKWAVLALWRQGYDSYAISYRIGVHECVVANDLMRIRQSEKLGGVNGNKAASS
jgi:hypothetical protein